MIITKKSIPRRTVLRGIGSVVALPFPLPYPGGSTTQLRVCSNGFISPAGSNGTSYSPQVTALLQGQPRWAAAWHDFTPNATAPVVLDSSPAVVRVTWLNVPNYGSGGANTFQVPARSASSRSAPGACVPIRCFTRCSALSRRPLSIGFRR